jgi:hypothetical protein
VPTPLPLPIKDKNYIVVGVADDKHRADSLPRKPSCCDETKHSVASQNNRKPGVLFDWISVLVSGVGRSNNLVAPIANHFRC